MTEQPKATIINPSIEIIPLIPIEVMSFQSQAGYQMKLIEEVGRTCYLSHDKTKEKSYEGFLRGIIKSGHESVIEHEKLTIRVTCSRSASHQLVRHRIGSYSQESQRFVNYAKKDTINFINDGYDAEMVKYLDECVVRYFGLVGDGKKAEDARAILPNATATKVAITFNFRQWRNFLKLRCDRHAQREIRSIALVILDQLYEYYPPLFADLYEQYKEAIDNVCYRVDGLNFEVYIINK